MIKAYLSILCVLSYTMVNATNYYVDAVNGNNANTGLSSSKAFKSIPTAAALTVGGDTVFIMAGVYPGFAISRPGNASAQIVYTNYPGSMPQITSSSSTYIAVTLSPGANYVTVNGLEVIGYGVNLSLAADTAAAQAAIVCPPGATSTTNVTFVPKYNGSGIGVGNNSTTTGTHHVVISNNKVHDCAAAGISFGNTDYITVDHNIVYNNSWYTPYGTSGISFGYCYNYDNNTTTYRNIVSNNLCYGNRLYVLWRGSCTISDGNGIILDVPQTDVNGKAVYNGKELVVNNVCFNNGGSGIHTITNNHVDFINNTAYMNSATPTNGGSAIYAYGSDDVKFYNNILVSRPGKLVNRCPNSTNVIYDYNIYSGGSSIDFVGAHSLIQDPKFVNASVDPTVADFHLQAGSFGINSGDNTHTYPLDKDNNSRPIASVVDIGAYESSYSGNLTTYPIAPVTQVLGSGGGTGEPGAIFYGPYDSKPSVNNQQGRRAFIYPQTLISSKGVPSTCMLTSLQFRRAVNAGNTQTIPDNSVVRIYLRNETSDNFGAAAFDWNTILPTSGNPATLVYGGEASPLIGNAGGWQTVNFQLPFPYTGGNLGVYIEYLQKGRITSAPDITWLYDNGGSQPLYNTATYPNQLYGSKAIASTSGVIPDNLTTNSERRPVIALGFITNSILPVAPIQKFNALRKGSSVYVSWIVSAEINNAGFDIQRSVDGINFTTIGFVASKTPNGNTTSIGYYDFTDLSPLDGISFYRLQQKDRDGTQTYSSIYAVTSVTRQISLASIYPNPVSTTLTALVNITGTSQMATISIRDLGGSVLSSFKKLLPAGYSNITLNLSRQASATYILVIELSSGETITQKFVKIQ